MNTERKRSRLIADMQLKEYRDALVAEVIRTGLPIQIRSLRDAQVMTQAELGKKAGMAQERICKLEDPDYGTFTITTLLRLASAFDVGLIVRFAPFSEIMNWQLQLSPHALASLEFAKEAVFHTSEEFVTQMEAVKESFRELNARREGPIINILEARLQREPTALSQLATGQDRPPLSKSESSLQKAVGS